MYNCAYMIFMSNDYFLTGKWIHCAHMACLRNRNGFAFYVLLFMFYFYVAIMTPLFENAFRLFLIE